MTKKKNSKEIILKEENKEINAKSEKKTKKHNSQEIVAKENDSNNNNKAIALKKSDNNKKGKSNKPGTFVYALGGLGEVGKNMYIVEHDEELWIIDSGIKFTSEILSIDGIIPSFEHLEKNENRIRGLIITHGHEDHIGAIPHLLNAIKIPKIYAGRLPSNQIWAKIIENKGLTKPKIEIINNSSKIKTKNFEFSFFNVNHSIPDSLGVKIVSPNGTIVSTGDFKFDLTSVGSRADFAKMARIGEEGVTLLLSDSTNAQVQTWSFSERKVSKSLEAIIKGIKNRVIIATFASNVYRVREAINIANKTNRKIVVFGWSMEKTIKIARKIKYINAADEMFISAKEMKKYDDDKILVLCTGTQGEPMAALSKMSNRNHPDIKIKASDTIIFASSAIPGNFLGVEKVINNLIKMNATVITNKIIPGIHASGHGGKLEQLLMLNLIKPKYFFPIHGETMMLIEHAKTAEEVGIRRSNSFILKNGDKLKVQDGHVSRAGSAAAKDIFVDGTNLTGQSLKVIQDRDQMAKNGFLSISVGIDSKKNEIIINPIINTKGILEEKTNKKIISTIEGEVKNDLEKYFKHSKKITFSGIKDVIKVSCENNIFKYKKLNPIVAPIILNIANPMETKAKNEAENSNGANSNQ